MTHINWNNTLRLTGINPWNPQMYPYEKENHIQDTKTYATLLHKPPEFGKLEN